jgi:hypothetical protein
MKIMSHTALKRSVYFECVSSGWCHQSAISGNQNGLLLSMWSEWQSLRFRLTCPQIFGSSGSEFNQSLAAAHTRVTWTLRPWIVSAMLFGVQYSSYLLYKSYGSKDNWWYPEAYAEGTILPYATFLVSMTDIRWFVGPNWFSAYFGKTSRY